MSRSMGVAGAGEAPLRRLSIDDDQSPDESADATGVWAHAAPIPNPTASTPSRAIPRTFTIGVPLPGLSPARVRRHGYPAPTDRLRTWEFHVILENFSGRAQVALSTVDDALGCTGQPGTGSS